MARTASKLLYRRMSRFAILLFAALAVIAPTKAFSPTSSSNVLKHCRSPGVPAPRSLTVVESAKILPVAYTSLSAACLYRAAGAATKADKAVLVATAALALFNLGPTDSARLASAKRACKRTSPPTEAAQTWRKAVRVKLAGQLVGLLWMTVGSGGVGVLCGASAVMASNALFFLCGAGKAMHDDDGEPVSMPRGVSTTVLTIDAVLTAAALVAASAPVESTRRGVGAGIYAVGAVIGALEGLAQLARNKTVKNAGAETA